MSDVAGFLWGPPLVILLLGGGLFFTAAEIGGVAGPLVIGFLHDLTGDFSYPLNVLTVVTFLLLGLLLTLQKTLKHDLIS